MPPPAFPFLAPEGLLLEVRGRHGRLLQAHRWPVLGCASPPTTTVTAKYYSREEEERLLCEPIWIGPSPWIISLFLIRECTTSCF